MKRKIQKIPHRAARLSVMTAMALAMGVSATVLPVSSGVAQAAPATTNSTASTTSLPSSVASGYKMTWHDEFDGNKLDTTKWGY